MHHLCTRGKRKAAATPYADRPMDLADASLVLASIATGITTIWTVDRDDFETYRLPGRKRFKLA